MGNKVTTKINEDDLNFLLANTQFNRDEIIEWHRKFFVKTVSRLIFLFYRPLNLSMFFKSGIVRRESWIRMSSTKFISDFIQMATRTGSARTFLECLT